MTGKKRLLLAWVAPPGPFVYVSPPLGLLYIAAWVRERFNLEIVVVHQRAQGWDAEQLVSHIVDFEPDIVGLGYMTPSAYALPVLTQSIRAALPDALLVLGGPHVSALGMEAVAATTADVGVVGEGEIAMEHILRAYIEGGDMADIPGIIWRNDEGVVVENPGTLPRIDDLDTLPMPAYDLLPDIRKIWPLPTMAPIPHRKYVSLLSSRGCPFGCTYCHNTHGRKWRAHSAERMVEEAAYALKQTGGTEIEYLDDCFNLEKTRVIAFSEHLCKTMGPVKMSFPNANRADLLDDESVDALVTAGMYYTALSLESGAPRIQALISKNLDISKYLNTVRLCAEKRVFTNGFVMLGFPTETAAEMEETIRVAAESKLHIASFFRVTPFPNTPIQRFVEERWPEKIAAAPYTEMDYRLIPVNLSSEDDVTIAYYTDKAYRTFYLKPGRLWRILRDYPQRHLLPKYGLMFLRRIWAGHV